MPNKGTYNLLFKLFEELITRWEAEVPIEEIGNDPNKVQIMREFRMVMQDQLVVVPERISQLYLKVYLRDVWAGEA